MDPLRRSLRLASREVHAAIGGTDCLRHGLRAASGALRAAIVPQHMPGLDAASCNLRAAACDWPTARGLRLADCGSRVCSQTKQLCRHHAHMPGINSASCNLRRAPCGRPTTRGLRLAERRLATRKRVERRHSTRIASCTSQLAGCDPAGRRQMVCCIPSLTHKYTPCCSHLLARALSQVAPRRNWGLVACDVLSCSRVAGERRVRRGVCLGGGELGAVARAARAPRQRRAVGRQRAAVGLPRRLRGGGLWGPLFKKIVRPPPSRWRPTARFLPRRHRPGLLMRAPAWPWRVRDLRPPSNVCSRSGQLSLIHISEPTRPY